MTHKLIWSGGNAVACSCQWSYTANTPERAKSKWRDHVDAELTTEECSQRSPARVKDPAGRVDWLLSQLIKEVAEKSANPLVRDAYGMFQPDIDALLAQHLGPKNRTLKPLRRAIKMGRGLYSQHRRKTA